jgi:hypothetical protein
MKGCNTVSSEVLASFVMCVGGGGCCDVKREKKEPEPSDVEVNVVFSFGESHVETSISLFFCPI